LALRTQLRAQRARTASVAVLIAIGSLALAACGNDDDDAGSGNPESQAVDYERALADAPAPLAELYAEGDVLIDGGVDAFEAQLDELRGYAVVVNKWASWCGPCRFEFPFFQSQAAKRGEEIAFLGVDSDDSEEAARTFLDELPLPYPSFVDQGSEIADEVLNAREFPATAFYDSSGELVHTKLGGYASEEELAADIRRYAR
jgi:cytochrome c biogenesis protein CcmG, thiol:disulfide interchange protein DsbE